MTRFFSRLAVAFAVTGAVSGFAPVTAVAATYYLDASTGRDEAAGTSPEAAWKSLTRVNATTFEPGDRLLLRAGNAWAGQLWPKGSGAPDRPIVVDRFGDGPNPAVHGDGGPAAVYLNNQEFWEINNLEVTNDGPTEGLRRGVLVRGENLGRALRHIRLRGLDVHHVRGKLGADMIAKTTGGIAFEVRGTERPTRFDDIVVENCTIRSLDNTGLYTYSDFAPHPRDPGWEQTRFTRVLIRGNRLVDIGKNAMAIRASLAPIIEHNVVENAAARLHGNAIYVFGCRDAIMQFNEVSGTRFDGLEGAAFDSDYNSEGTIIQYNYSHDNGGGLANLCNNPASAPPRGYNDGTIVRYNISQNDTQRVIAFDGPVTNTLIHNNTIYVGPGLAPRIVEFDTFGKAPGYASQATFRNNIIVNHGAGTYGFGGSREVVFEGNCISGGHAADEPADPRKITSDPRLVAPGTGGRGLGSLAGYQLLPDSPCLESGIAIDGHGGRDFWGNPLYQGRPDRGAFEAPGHARGGSPRPPEAGEIVPLWPEGVPGRLAGATPEVLADGRVSNVHDPALIAYPAPAGNRTGTAVVVCPGGAYRRLAIEKEGRTVAAWLNSLGVSAFVLKYRLREYGHPSPLRDVLRALRVVRSEARRWNLDPGRIGVLGFSAGGHLASSAGTLYDAPEGRTGAPLDAVSARPDFMVLVYPVVTLDGPHASVASRESLLGTAPSPTMIEQLSTHLRVTPQTPPAFIAHGGTDRSVPPENSVLLYSALRRHAVPAELHLYETGPHGVGLEPDHGPISAWPKRCEEWMAGRGLLDVARAQGASPSATPGRVRYRDRVFEGVDVKEDITFAGVRGADGAPLPLRLDVYEPRGDAERARPAIMWIHGGGFRPGNDKRQGYIVRLATEFARRGYVSFAIDYRVRERPEADLAGTVEDAVQDASAALEWIRRHAAEHGVDPLWIAVGGGSAGGVTTVNLVARENAQAARSGRRGVFAAINLWGSPSPSRTVEPLNASFPPTVIIHGTRDTTIPYALSEDLAGRLKALGVGHVLHPIPDASHTPTEHLDSVADVVAGFVSDLFGGR